jgi:hypothetical protein
MVDAIARLRTAGEFLQPRLRDAIRGLGPRAAPRLIELVNDEESGWAGIHAADLLIDMKATEAIEPLLRILGEVSCEDELFNRVALRLHELGPAVLEPALRLLAEHDDDDEDDTLQGVCEVLTRLGVRDDRILDAIREAFASNPFLGAILFEEYGDARNLPLLEEAILRFQPDLEDTLSWDELSALLDAHERLGGTLPPEVREQADAWLAEWKKRHAQGSVPVTRSPKIGRNDACPCGSGKKYKKCCLDADEATRRAPATHGGT